MHTPGTAYYEALCDELAAGELESGLFRGKGSGAAGNAAASESARASTNRSASGRSSVSLSTVATSAWALETHSAGLRQQLIRCVPAQELARLHSGVVQTHIPGGDMSERDVCCRVYGDVTVPRLLFESTTGKCE